MISDETGFEYSIIPNVGRKWWIHRRFTFYWIIFGLGIIPSAIFGAKFDLEIETGLDFLLLYLAGVLFLGIIFGSIYYISYIKYIKKSINNFVFNLQSEGIKIYKNEFIDFVLKYDQIRGIVITQNSTGRKTNSKCIQIIAEGDFTSLLQGPKSRIALSIVGSVTGNSGLVNGNIQGKRLLIIIDGLNLNMADKLKEKLLTKIPTGSLRNEMDPFWKIQLGDGETVAVSNFL